MRRPRILTVHQPWAWGLVHGPKRIENRPWTTTYRGPVFIHAGLSRASMRPDALAMFPNLPGPDMLPFGAVVGLVDLVDVRPLAECRSDPFAIGPWCLITANPRALREPIACRGSLGLLDAPEALDGATLASGQRLTWTTTKPPLLF